MCCWEKCVYCQTVNDAGQDVHTYVNILCIYECINIDHIINTNDDNHVLCLQTGTATALQLSGCAQPTPSWPFATQVKSYTVCVFIQSLISPGCASN